MLRMQLERHTTTVTLTSGSRRKLRHLIIWICVDFYNLAREKQESYMKKITRMIDIKMQERIAGMH